MSNILRRLNDRVVEWQAKKEEEKRLKEAEQRAVKLREQQAIAAYNILVSRLEKGDLSLIIGEEQVSKMVNFPKQEYPVLFLDGITYSEQRVAIRGSYSSIRVRPMKNVSLGLGGWQSEPITELRKIDFGTLQITNKRIRFDGDQISKEIKLFDIDRLTHFPKDIGRIRVAKRGRERQMYFLGINKTQVKCTIENRTYDVTFTGQLVNSMIIGLQDLVLRS